MDRLRRAFIGSAAGWALALPLATFEASRAHVSTLAAAASLVVYTVGALVCHQLPLRSFHLWGVQMPVCARCLGIYVGAAVAGLAAAGLDFGARSNARLKPRATFRPFVARGFSRARRFTRAQLLAAVAVAPTALTLVYEWTTGIMPPNPIRFAAGLWLGALLAAMVVTATPAPPPEVN